jgi:type IV pilus assembly protein PilM
MNLFSIKAGSKPGGRPPVAVELAPEGVLAGALPKLGHTPAYAFQPLPAGALVPGTVEVNLSAPDVVSTAIRSALSQVSPRTHVVTLVVPDSVVRVLVLDFDAMPSRAAEAYPVLRLRLRKMLPFDVEKAGLSYQILSQDKTQCRVLVAVLPGPVLAEYEAVVRAAGYEPGVVLPSGLAALETINSTEPALSASLSGLALTTAITNGRDLLLYRTLDLPEDPELRLSEVQRDITVAAAYFEDKLINRPSRLHYAGIAKPSEFASWIDTPELEVIDWAPRPETGAVTTLGNISTAGIAGALAGAR